MNYKLKTDLQCCMVVEGLILLQFYLLAVNTTTQYWYVACKWY